MSRIELQIINKTARIAPGKKKLNFLLEYTQKSKIINYLSTQNYFFSYCLCRWHETVLDIFTINIKYT